MEKRYQVFVSSTFTDLKDERQSVLKAILELDHMPAGMELFPAADDSAWQLIKDVIDSSDYYVLIIGGRYGSLDETGIGYTEKEYDYAVDTQTPVIALLHKNPDNLPRDKTETDDTIWEKLKQFRSKVESKHTCVYWNSPEELKAKVIVGLTTATKRHPRTGWVRADKASSEDLLQDIHQIRKENEKLRQALSKYEGSIKADIQDLASLDEKYKVIGDFRRQRETHNWSHEISWRDLFGLIAPYLLEIPHQHHVRLFMSKSLFDFAGYKKGHSIDLKDQAFQTIKVQLMAIKLINVEQSLRACHWSLTPQGEALMFETRTIRSKSAETSTD